METKFLGYKLKSPVIVASSPATENVQNLMKCYNNGVGAVILKTAAEYQGGEISQKRKWYWGENGIWAQSSFEREVSRLTDCCQMIQEVKNKIDIPIIASVTSNSWNIEGWLEGIERLVASGADMVQLDLFYLSQEVDGDKMEDNLKSLLKSVCGQNKCMIIPKLNINMPLVKVNKVLKEAGIKGVSILDSVRVPPPVEIDEYNKLKYPKGIGSVGTSCFGNWQLPLTEAYLYEAVKEGLEVCAGGGICSPTDGIQLLMRGAKTIQVATGILRNGFSWLMDLNNEIDCFLGKYELTLEELWVKGVELVKCE